jgi:AcrR family transcriptional regulator
MGASTAPTLAFAQATSIRAETTRTTPADAFKRAREIIQTGGRLDMVALASELGIARATLYRWTGDRERLLSDILWLDAQELLEHVERTTTERGADGIRRIVTRFLTLLATTGRLTTFLRIEGRNGFRLLTDSRGGVRPRLVDSMAMLIQREADDGFYRPPEEPQLLADAMVSLGERFLYHGGYVEENPDAEAASRMVALLIREAPR